MIASWSPGPLRHRIRMTPRGCGGGAAASPRGADNQGAGAGAGCARGDSAMADEARAASACVRGRGHTS
jgi:hypothetical protein